MDATSRSLYITRMNAVIDYIHANLSLELSLEVLAKVAGFSPYHFHRLFKSLMQETIFDYVQRARLEKAAHGLIYLPDCPVLEIALECGFSGAAVFTRAFKDHFGTSPTAYRRATQRKNRKVDSKLSKDAEQANLYPVSTTFTFKELQRSEQDMDVQVKDFPNFHVAYIRHVAGYTKGMPSPAVGEAFQKVCTWAGAHGLFGPQTRVIGIPYDNPEVTPNDRCRYDACVTVPANITAAAGEIGVQEISGGKYAVSRISIPKGQEHIIGETVDRMYGEWLPASGFTVDDKPPLEIYYDTPTHAPGTWLEMEFCIPIKPL